MDGWPVTSDLPWVASATDPDRLSDLFACHHQRLYRLARRLSSSTDDALDLVQDTFVRAATHLASVPLGRANEEAWLVRVLINLRRDQWRRAGVRNRHDAHARASEATVAAPEGALIARMALWRALDALAPRRRAVIVMHELEGLPIPAIARLLGVTAVTVRWHLSKARRQLAAALRHQLRERDDQR
jgi:RNA polymerase sigma factor (sigma-70 family)